MHLVIQSQTYLQTKVRMRKKKMIKRKKISEHHNIKRYAVLIFGVVSALFVIGIFIYGISDEHTRERLLMFFIIFIPVAIVILLVSLLIDFWKTTKPK